MTCSESSKVAILFMTDGNILEGPMEDAVIGLVNDQLQGVGLALQVRLPFRKDGDEGFHPCYDCFKFFGVVAG